MSLKNGLCFAMEEDAAVAASTAEMVPETQAEVETATAEVAEQVGEVEQMDDAVVDAETDAGTLGDIQEVMSDAVETGEGLPEEAAAVAEIAIESIRQRLGMKAKSPRSVMPALESFGSKGSRLAATKIALEGVADTIKTIWANIIKALKWVWEKIKSFFLTLTKNRALLLKHLEGLQVRVKAFTAEGGAKTVTGGSAKAFNIDGKADFSTAEKVLGDSAKLLKSIGVGAAAAAAMVNKLTDVKSGSDVMGKAGADLLDSLRGSLEPMGKVSSAKAGVEDKISTHYGNLVGGQSVGVSSSKEGSAATVAIQLESNQGDAAKEAATLDKAQMEKIVAQSIDLVKSLQNFDKVEKDLANITKACEGVSQAVIKGTINASESKDEAAGLKEAAANIRSLNSMVAKFGASLPSAVFNAAKAGGDYVTASMAAAGKKEKAAAAVAKKE